MVVAARLYHVHGVRQRDIAERLGTSQARVSRLLRQAGEAGIVQTVVAVPEGIHSELEESLEAAYDLQEAHVVDVPEGAPDLATVLGRAAARYLAEATFTGETIGFTSWSRTFQEMARAMPELPRTGARRVVEMLGDLGAPVLQHAATRSTQDLARALGAEAVFLRTPGVVGSSELRATLLADPHVGRALARLDHLEVAFVGVGPADLHSLLEAEDNYFSAAQLAAAREAGAVGQLVQRFIDADGRPVETPLDDLVIGATLAQVRAARRRVVVAGGLDKQQALAAALRGRWVDVLVVDTSTARFLLELAEPLPATALAP
ncbi:DNA-binding transcriptional regulator [Nocardioides psychrotolerans]|nr:DNA-binding transcriptional regulator [Nocardioides psychrotolerans]